MTERYDYILAGAGAAGLLVAYRMLRHPDMQTKRVLLIDREAKTSDDRTWCYWEQGAGLFDDILHDSWDRIIVADDKGQMQREISPYRYKMLRSSKFYAFIRNALADSPRFDTLEAEIMGISTHTAHALVRTSVGDFEAEKVLDSTTSPVDLSAQDKYPLLQQHFVGHFVRSARPVFDPEVATMMDFSIDQKGNTRFMYVLPTSENEALVEYTLFSKELLPMAEYEQAIEAYLVRLGVGDYEVVERERGSIPMCSYPLWKHDTAHHYRIGTAGGWTKASTGYTFHNSINKSAELVAALAKDMDLSSLKGKDRFWWYDAIMLDVLYRHNETGRALFGQLFRKCDVRSIFRFLDDESTFFRDELPIVWSMPSARFTLTAFRRFFG